jgi:hypothetical protein
MEKNMFSYQFFKTIDQISILLKLLCVTLEKEVWFVPRRHFNFSSISRKWTIMGHMSLDVIFGFLLDAHAVQFGINFDNNIEIHL